MVEVMPKIGIPPDDRRAPQGNPGVARNPDDEHGEGRCGADRYIEVPERQTGRMRDCGYDHRRRQRSRRLRREVCARGRHGDADRHAVLVLRLRNDGYGPADPEGGLGLQRHRAARARSIWPRCWRRMRRKGCRLSASTGATFRRRRIRRFRTTSAGKFSGLRAPRLRSA